MPRIISGTARGIILDVPQGMKTRPTSDRAKEALFSILAGVYEGFDVLDLFSGTGSLGLECLSRGAESCIFVDSSRRAADIIRRNIEKCRFSGYCRVITADVRKAVDFDDIANRRFKCIFMDPPYDRKLLTGVIEKISENDIMEKNGILVVEHSGDEVPPDEIGEFTCSGRRNYGAVNFSFYNQAEIEVTQE
jgi:16S rRNA (guanine(966)-N(2))-methyltransferase RsmD